VDGPDKMKVVIREILEDKIFLDQEMNVRTRPEPGQAAGAGEIDFDKI
jgi:hypothetical protein